MKRCTCIPHTETSECMKEIISAVQCGQGRGEANKKNSIMVSIERYIY